MTPIQSAARAGEQQIWPVNLRISEVAQAPLNSSGRPQLITYAEILRKGFLYLQAGWRWLERRRTQQLSSRRLRLTETISLGEKRSVSIVVVDGTQFLIGCSTGSVQLLAVLDKQNDGVKDLSDTPDREMAL